MRLVLGFLSDELKRRIISQVRKVFADMAWRFTIRRFFPCCKSILVKSGKKQIPGSSHRRDHRPGVGGGSLLLHPALLWDNRLNMQTRET